MEVMRHALAATAIIAVMMMCAVFVTAYALFFKRVGDDEEGEESDD